LCSKWPSHTSRERSGRRERVFETAIRSVKVTGLAQKSQVGPIFDCKSLLTASSWPNVWANPVIFTLVEYVADTSTVL
jgi:hypothetical protein